MKLTSLRAALTGAALVACGLLAVPAAANAAPPSVAGHRPRAVPAAEAATAAAYWTPERMRAAVPADVLLADKAASTPAGDVAAGAPVTYGKPAPAGEIEPDGDERVADPEHRQGVLHAERPQLRLLGATR